MTNYKMTLCYDGTRYSGWQVQGNTENTIQGKIETLLSAMVGEKVDVNGSGRTDAGVHAYGQVANFKISDRFPTAQIKAYLDENLPRDIAVIALEPADDRFHARLSAKSKTYIYRIHTDKASNVFERKYVYDYTAPLNVDRMREAAGFMIGTHDFKAFCGNPNMKKSTVRTVTSIEIKEKTGEIELDFTGNGFLMNMVRIMTGTLIEVGSCKRSPSEIPAMLESMSRANAGFTAPAQGLALLRVEY